MDLPEGRWRDKGKEEGKQKQLDSSSRKKRVLFSIATMYLH